MRARRCRATVVWPLPALPTPRSGSSASTESASNCSRSSSAVTSGRAARWRPPSPTPSTPGRAAVPAPPPREAAASPRAETPRPHHPAPRLPPSLRQPAGEALLVGLAFAIGVEEPRHRREAPVHHADAGGHVDEGRPSQAVVAARLTLSHAEVSEVRGAWVGGCARAWAFDQGADQAHLLEDRGQILRRRLDRLLAQLGEAS